MLKNILTGGIDLPELSSKVAALSLNYEGTNAALADHIAKVHDLIGNRASADDLDTLKQRVERLSWESEVPLAGGINEWVSGQKTLGSKVAILEATVASLQLQITSLTATKLAEVRARKAKS